jgi:hypothetical protein
MCEILVVESVWYVQWNDRLRKTVFDWSVWILFSVMSKNVEKKYQKCESQK